MADEAVETAQIMEYEGVPARVVIPEYLIALFLQPEAKTRQRRERAAKLMEWRGLNRARLDAILEKHALSL